MYFDSIGGSGNKAINCDVSSCRHNNEKGKCTLSDVQISCTCNEHNCHDSYYTICNSFSPSVDLNYEMAEEIVEELRV